MWAHNATQTIYLIVGARKRSGRPVPALTTGPGPAGSSTARPRLSEYVCVPVSGARSAARFLIFRKFIVWLLIARPLPPPLLSSSREIDCIAKLRGKRETLRVIFLSNYYTFQVAKSLSLPIVDNYVISSSMQI